MKHHCFEYFFNVLPINLLLAWFELSMSFVEYQFFLGALTGAITTPLDVIKTRLMVQVRPVCFLSFFFNLCFNSIYVHTFNVYICFDFLHTFSYVRDYMGYFVILKGSANQYKGIFDCVQTIVREEGPPALLKVGYIVAIILRTCPNLT